MQAIRHGSRNSTSFTVHDKNLNLCSTKMKNNSRRVHGRSIRLNQGELTDEEFANEMEDPRRAFIPVFSFGLILMFSS